TALTGIHSAVHDRHSGMILAGARGLTTFRAHYDARSSKGSQTSTEYVNGIGEIETSAFDGRLIRTNGAAGDVVFDLRGAIVRQPIADALVSTRSRSAQSMEMSITLENGHVEWSTPDGRSGRIDVDVTPDFGSVVIVGSAAWIGHRSGITVIIDNGTNAPGVIESDDIARIIDVHPLLDGTGVVAVSDMMGVRVFRR
ncbi:MAG: hypothetical protein KC983_08905, partial [Phycisphaerales bacterium]|nr:hypothetical protein [Phycisphaerales bacterium]